jgi:hypothetical protein
MDSASSQQVIDRHCRLTTVYQGRRAKAGILHIAMAARMPLLVISGLAFTAIGLGIFSRTVMQLLPVRLAMIALLFSGLEHAIEDVAAERAESDAREVINARDFLRRAVRQIVENVHSDWQAQVSRFVDAQTQVKTSSWEAFLRAHFTAVAVRQEDVKKKLQRSSQSYDNQERLLITLRQDRENLAAGLGQVWQGLKALLSPASAKVGTSA